jgi:ribonucleoside-triphosphate reductase
MEFGPIGEEVFNRTYSRTKPDGTKETWPETVARVAESNVLLGGLLVEDSAEEIAELTAAMLDFKVIPAGRHLWAAGAPTNLGLFNCHRAGWGRNLSDHFVFTFDQLMLGGGVGANYSSEYLTALPRVTADVWVLDEPSYYGTIFEVEDSREGWVAALKFLIDAAADDRGGMIYFDTSRVRPAGAPIRGFGGTASGPGPLVAMLKAVATTLRKACDSHQGHLTPLLAMEIDHDIASCVVAGNVRRSARMSILHWEDPSIEEFITCKENSSKHWSTNISVEVDDEFWSAAGNLLHPKYAEAHNILSKVSAGMLHNGEPGLFNSSLAAEGEHTGADVRSTNPCGEIALEPWEQCCLGHVNLAHPAHEDPRELARSFRLMARFLVRATTAASSDHRQEAIKSTNRRIGVGIFGFQEWLARLGIRYSESWKSGYAAFRLQEWKAEVRRAASAEADRLHVSRPVKVTTVAPTGTIAKLPGTTEGIHPVYAKYFKRRVRYASDSPELARLRAEGHPTEPDIYAANTEVVTFFVEELAVQHYGDVIESVDEVNITDLFAVQKLVQDHYADNAVSFTANISPDSYDEHYLSRALLAFGPYLKGTTVFPDLSRPLSPMERITREEYDSATTHEVGQSINDECTTGACPVR